LDAPLFFYVRTGGILLRTTRTTPSMSTPLARPHPKTNCATLESGCAAPYYHQNRFKNDACFVATDTAQSTLPGQYQLQNYYDCTCMPRQSMSVALNQPVTQFKDGYGYVGQRGCLVENDTAFRHGSELTNKKGAITLHERPYLTVPYMGRGVGNPCKESELQEGITTQERKQCNTLAGIHLPHQYTPLVDCLAKEIQDPKHIVPEANRDDWIRGGYPSRQWVHSQHFDRRCPSTEQCRCPEPSPAPVLHGRVVQQPKRMVAQ
jgi:hypothetical protein